MNLVIEYNNVTHNEEELKLLLEGELYLTASDDEPVGVCRVLKFGQVVELLAEEKKRIYDEGWAAGYAAKKRKKK